MPPSLHLGEGDAALGRKLLQAEVKLLAQHICPVLRFRVGGFLAQRLEGWHTFAVEHQSTPLRSTTLMRNASFAALVECIYIY